ncbi:MAG: Hpt domain-containing protein, partial [Gammaproteobacteria bacterium]|nr:Hpt domain-containing protein [Gammaproteobacteria bacterium]
MFMEEGDEILDSCENALNEWLKSPMNMEVISSIQRQLHTLKGGARMAGIKPMGDLCHSMEAMLLAVAEEQVQPTDEMVHLVQSAYDELLAMLEKVKLRQSMEDAADLIEKAQKVLVTGTTSFLEDKSDDSDMDTSTVGEFVATIEETVESSPVVETESVQTEDYVSEDFDEDDGELLDVFLEEAEEILNACEETLQHWIKSPEDRDVIAEIQRQLHTLKGGARMAQIKPMGDLGHVMESMLIAVSEERVPPSTAMVHLVQQAYDELLSMLDMVKKQQAPDEANDLIAKAQRVIDTGLTDFLDEAAAVQQEPLKEATPESVQEKQKTGSGMEEALGRLFEDSGDKKPIPGKGFDEAESDTVSGLPKQTGRGTQEQVRVSAELIDNLVNFGGEVSIYRSRLEQQVNSMKFNLHEMDQTVVRLHDQLRNLDIETEAQMIYRMEEASPDNEEFDPLEFDRFTHMQQLSRSLMESVTDIVSIQRMLENITRESETLLLQQSRVNTDLQEGLMRTRMVPFASQLPRLRRIVRQTANEVGKSAELKVLGAEGEMDRTMLDRIMPALEHMLRNSIDHGIETPAARKKVKKPAAGQIKISFTREGSDVVLRLTDDGGGIKQSAIRKKAIESGLLDKNTDITENELLQFILESGFSTAEAVTQISGRGVGMDVVNNEIKQLGGSLHIDSTEGKGTTFTVVLPFTLSINRALMINVADETLAIPLLSVEGIARINAGDVQQYYQENAPEYEFAGNKYQLLHMGTLLGIGRPQVADSNRKYPLLLVRTGEHRVALQVDGLMGSREIVVKPVGPQLSAIRGVSGATIMGDGRVVLIIDIHALVRMDIAHHSMEASIDEVERQKEEAREPVIMIVDDSITVRKVTERFLKRNKLVSVAARDGVEALAMLQDTIPDVMLLDIEMPRMDGFELATH